MKNIVIGQYVPGTGFFHRLDPRTKILAIIVLMAAVFLLKTILQVAVSLLVLLAIMLAGRISILRVARGLRPLFVLLVFTFGFQIFFNREGALWWQADMNVGLLSLCAILVWTVIWRFSVRLGRFRGILFILWLAGVYAALVWLPAQGPVFTTFSFEIYQRGVEMSVFVVIRLLVVIALSTILTLTTKPTDLTQGLESLLRPLKGIGVNSDDFALIISISLRYIPTILDEANKIMSAQASRGADFAEGKFFDKVKQIISLLVPMFIIAFKRSEDLADAMESRDFVPGKPRTRIHELAFGAPDVVTAVATVLFLAGSIVARVLS
jgi:energy-coupling factor transport system permease protein